MNRKKILKKEQRKKRVRSKIFGTSERPRLSIFKSNRYIYAQLINDDEGKTLCSVSAKQSETKDKKRLGESIAEKAVEKGIKKAVFDRGSYKYHGRIKEIAEGARKGGLQL